MAMPDAWQDVAFVAIQKKGSTAQNFTTITETLDIGEPDYPGEGLPNLAGGRIWKQTSQEDGEITIEMYPISTDWMKGSVISSIASDGSTVTLTTSAVHGMALGDKFRVTNTTNYGTEASPIIFTVSGVTSTTIVTASSAINQATETDGTVIAFLGNKGLFQQAIQYDKVTEITTIDGDADSIDIASTAHGCQVGDIVTIGGTTNYNGTYVVGTRTDADNFKITDDNHSQAEETVGTVKKISDGSQPLTTGSGVAAGIDRVRDRYMVVIMWTDDGNQLSPLDATSATDSVALRFYAKACKIISHKADFTDGILKVTATFKFPAFDKAGTTKLYAWESTEDGDTDPLPALTYT